MIEFVELFVVGIGVGAFGALVGIGGGMIMVPLFMLTMMALHSKTFSKSSERVCLAFCLMPFPVHGPTSGNTK